MKIRIRRDRLALPAALALGLSCSAPAVAQQLTVGQPAPAFALQTLDGRTITKATFRGRTLVINVWGSWCPPCRIETPDLIAQARTAGAGVVFVGVDTTETPAVVRAFAAAKGVFYPQVVTASDSAFARAYDIRNYPTTFVIDPHGVLRARHADNVLPPRQLAAYIRAARHGATAPLVSVEQHKLDELLAPATYPLQGSAAAVVANARAAAAAIERADAEMDDAMTDSGRDHDLVATQAEEQTLRNAAIVALQRVAATPADRALLARLRGDGAAAAGDWPTAQAAYAAALKIDPSDRAALAAESYAASQRGDLAGVARLDARIAAMAPSVAADIAVTRSQAALGHRRAAFAALERAVALAGAHGTPAQRAWTHLYGGRAAIELGDVARARHEFSAAATAAAAIPHANPRYAMYLEQAQEGAVALTLRGATRTSLSLAPWTGPELPGSLASTLKYRLVVTARPASTVGLAASGLPKGWIGSFCSDRLCSPFTTTVGVPSSGVKIVEFQIIPSAGATARTVVRIEASAQGAIVASASASVMP